MYAFHMALAAKNDAQVDHSTREESAGGILLRDGVVHLRKLVAPDLAQALKATLERVLQGISEIDAFRAAWEIIQRDGGFQFRSLAGDAVLLSRLTEVVHAALMPHRIWLADFLGGPPVVPMGFVSYRFHRVVDGAVSPHSLVAYHQDRYFIGTGPMVNFWTPLDDCGVDAPGLEVVRGAETRDLRPVIDATHNAVGNPIASFTPEQIRALYPAASFFQPVMTAGDALAFHDLTPHRTYTTPSMNKPRSSLEIRVFREGAMPDFAPLFELRL